MWKHDARRAECFHTIFFCGGSKHVNLNDADLTVKIYLFFMRNLTINCHPKFPIQTNSRNLIGSKWM